MSLLPIYDAPFDAAALILLCITLISMVFRRVNKGTPSKILLSMVICTAVASVINIADTALLLGNETAGLRVFLSNVYIVLMCFNLPAATAYTICAADAWHKIEKKPVIYGLLAAPFIAILVSLVINPAESTFISPFSSSPAQVINYYVFAGECAFYCSCCMGYILRYRKQLGFRKSFCLSIFVVFTIAALVSMALFPQLSIHCFLISLFTILAATGVQRPEDYIDPYTHLYNQLCYTNVMRNGFTNGKHAIVIMFNIGNYDSLFKMLGYDATSDLIASVADEIVSVKARLKCRADLYYLDVGRYRIVFGENDMEGAEAAAALLLTELNARSRHMGIDINLMPFITIARCPEDIESFKSLMSFGKDFHKKFQYSGRVVPIEQMYDPNEFALQNDIDQIIDKALENSTFQVYYQPIYSVEEKRFVSAEALLRLCDEKYGFINPELIVTAAERSGTIHKIGDYVFEEVCKFIASDEYKSLRLDYIEINLSVAQCMHSDLAFKVIKLIKKYGISPSAINLEITETAASYSQKAMTDNLRRLSEAGINFSLDDYGTGYSNMKRVIQLPLKIVKIDKSLVDEQSNPKMWVFLQNTVKMLKEMDLEIVVEGIETAEMVNAFSRLQCDFIQGYYFSKALCKKDFIEFIRQSYSEKTKEEEVQA